jgi:hypothetical protein
MSCRVVDGVLDHLGDGAGITPEVRRHIEECSECRSLYGWMAAAPAGPEISSESASRIARSLTASLRPTRPLASHRIIISRLLLLIAVAALALTGIMGTAGFERMRLAQILSMSVLLTAGAFLFSVSLSWQIRPGSYQRLPAAAILAAFGVGVLAGISLFFPWQASHAFLAQGMPCLIGGTIMAVTAAVLLWLVVRHGAPLSIPTFGATLGATAGLLALTVLQIQCPFQEASHLLFFHGGAVVLSTLGGWAVGHIARLLAAHR